MTNIVGICLHLNKYNQKYCHFKKKKLIFTRDRKKQKRLATIYLDLLTVNSLQVFSAYYEDAEIFNKLINEPYVYSIALAVHYSSSVINIFLSHCCNNKTRKKTCKHEKIDILEFRYQHQKIN